MKNSLFAVAITMLVILLLGAAGQPDNQEVVLQLKEQNRQLSRIASSLERISGQQPGWKLPK